MNDSNERFGQAAQDVKRMGQDVADGAKDAALGLAGMAESAADAGRSYAREATNAAGKKLDGAKTHVDQLANYLTLSINADPIKAVVVTAGLSALLTALFVASLGGRRR
jgi:hypothetical protein